MALRSKDDLCLLCLHKKADKTGSHFTPAGLIKKVFGSRNYEDILSLNPGLGLLSHFYGRSNLSNNNVEIIKEEHVENHIFCSLCEDKLSIIENKCIEKLNDLSDNLIHGQLSIKRTKKGNEYFTTNKIDKNILILFFISIIWRQCLQQKIRCNNDFPSLGFQESLRKLIFFEIYKPLNEIIKSLDFKNYPRIIILTTYHNDDNTKYFINPNPFYSNPQLFFLGIYSVLIFDESLVNIDFTIQTGINKSILDDELIINNSSSSIISIINKCDWDNINISLRNKVSEKYINTLVLKVVNTKGWTYEYAEKILHIKATDYLKKYPENYPKCLIEAVDFFLNNAN